MQSVLPTISSVWIAGTVLSFLARFNNSNRSQYFVVVVGYRSNLVNVVSEIPQCRVLGPLLFLLYTSKLFSIQESTLCNYADDSTLVAVVPSPLGRVSVAESLNCDLNRVDEWCEILEKD